MISVVCYYFVLIGSIELVQTDTNATTPPMTVVHDTSGDSVPVTTIVPEPEVVQIQDCGEDDLKFTYTPCDENDNRWRVQVPKKENCRLKEPQEPMQGIKCSFSCKPGQYLDITTQNCQQCLAGTYSIGDGKRFSNWEKIPEGFISQGFDTSKSSSGSIPATPQEDDVCKDAKWKAKGYYLESNGSTCRSVLQYTVDLVRDGNISFTVKSGDESSLFHVWVDNDISCSRSDYDNGPGEERLDKYFTVTTEWKRYKMDLTKGRNIVYFLAAHFSSSYDNTNPVHGQSFDSDSEKTVMIKELIVRGFSSSYDCDVCPAGTYSSPGSTVCTSCPENTYSKAGAEMCISCGLEEYSVVRADNCVKRVACSEKDYYMMWIQCKNAKTRKMFQWKEPRICNPLQTGAVQLPPASDFIDCPSCNPGQYNNGTDCVYCPKDHYSSGSEECKMCPPTTRGAPGVFYKFWKRYPGLPMRLYCLAKPDSGCSTTIGWMVQDEYMSTGSGHSDDAELLLVLTIPEFTKETNEFKIEFSIYCPSDKCRFKIELMDSDESLHVIRTYEGQTARTTYVHVRHSSSPARYRLVFEKKYLADRQTFQYTDSRLKIYSIAVTNVKVGGTETCEKCASDGEDCIKCSSGKYIDNGKCHVCPRNTYLLNKDNPFGEESCKPCPVGTVSAPASRFCHSNCQIKGNDNRNYNFSALSGLHIINGQKRFTTKGYLYYHQFKVNFCGEEFTESECANNATNKVGYAAKAAICRSTIIPDNNMVVSAQSISIGQVLEDITSVTIKAQKDNTSSIKRSQSDEITFKFHSDRTTEVCKNGTFGIIRLVCDPYQAGRGKIELGDGNACLSETCDGCNYTFTMKSKHACAICVASDYEVIDTSCVEGVKRTHYVWKQPHVCVDYGIKPIDSESVCTIFEKSILDFKVIILAFLVGGLVLAVIVLYLCYRNRTLSYNYHRLIDASHVKEGEMPASEMCALEDGEEEEEEVIIAKGKAGTKILDRLRGMRKKKKDFSEFETINLDSMQGYSDDDDEI